MVDKEKIGTDPGPVQDEQSAKEAVDEAVDRAFDKAHGQAGNIVSGAFGAADELQRPKTRRVAALATAIAGAVIAVWAWRRRRRPPTRTEQLGHALEDAAHRTLDQAGKAVTTTRRQARKAMKTTRSQARKAAKTTRRQARKALKSAQKTDLKQVADKARANVPGLH